MDYQLVCGRYMMVADRSRLIPYLFIAPAAIYFAVFWAYPVFEVVFLSFTSYDFLSPPKYVGGLNYITLAHDPLFFKSIFISVEYAFVSQLLTMFIGLTLALVINSKLRGMGIFRILYFIPVVASSVAISLIWKTIFDPVYGPLNAGLGSIGVPPQYWLQTTNLALPSLMIMVIWQFSGYQMFLFLSGLQTIPPEYYQAASIDGASTFKQFYRITLPLLKPTLLFVLVLATIGGLQVFTPVYVMTGGGPYFSTYTTMFYIYQEAFHYLNVGYASAMSVVFFLLTSVIIGIEIYLMRKGGMSYYATKV